MSSTRESMARRKSIAEAVATEAAFVDESCAKYNRAALIVAETIIDNAQPWYRDRSDNEVGEHMRDNVNKLAKQRIRKEYGLVVSSWIILAVLSGIISAITKILIERWLRREGVSLYDLRIE